MPALTTAWCAAARLWGCCLFLFFHSSPCGNEQTWHLPPSHSNPANQVCFVKNNYTVIFNAAQIKRSLKSDGDFQSDVKHDLNMHLTPRQDSKTIKQEAGDDSPRGRDNIKHITLEPVHHVLILCYTILFVCCKNVQFCFLWRPCTTRDKLIHTYGSIFPLERSHTIRGCSENVLKKNHWNTSEMHWSAPTGGGRVYKFLPRYLCSCCTRRFRKSSLAAGHCFSGRGGVICTTTNGQKLLFSSTRHVGHVTEPGLRTSSAQLLHTIGRQERRLADTNLQPRSCNFKKCFHWLCGWKMSS